MTTRLDIDNLLYNYTAYSSDKIYEKDKVVIYNNKYYRCNEDITEPEEWNSEKWTLVSENELALDNLLLQNSITQFRYIPEYVAMCKSHADGLLTIKVAVDYLLKYALNVYKAQGIWLDYIGWLVGIKRSYNDISKFFSVNRTDNISVYAWTYNNTTVYTLSDEPEIDDDVYSIDEWINLGKISSVSNNSITVEGVTYTKDISKNTNANTGDLNEEKYFWFESGSVSETSNLDDEIYRKRILGKILYNKSKCTRNENIAIIKYMTNAEHCIITKVEALLCDITLYGDDIVETISLKNELESFLYEGCGIRNLTIRSSSDYE